MEANAKKSSRTSKSRRQVVLHPILFALNPILFFYVESFAFVDVGSIERATTLSLAAAALGWVTLRRWLDDLHKSALLTSLTFLLFFAYQAIVDMLGDLGWFPSTQWVPGAHAVLLATMGAVWYGAAELVRKYPIQGGWTYIANVAGTAAVIFPFLVSGKLTYEAFVIQDTVEWKHESLPVAGNSAMPEPPDIYWILPDAYARGDVLAALYDYDDSPFLDALRQRGFAIAPKAVSTYSTTAASVASALNMEYAQNLVTGVPEDYSDWRLIRRLLNENRLNRFLKTQGYTTYSVEAQNTNVTWRSDSIVSRWWFLNDYERVLLDHTPISPLSRMLGVSMLHEHHRARTRFALDWVGRATDLPGPKFVFVQLVTPHPPFIFNTEGEAVNPPWPYTQVGGLGFYWMQEGATKEDYHAGYLDQVRFISRRLIEVVDQIQAGSERLPIIVLLSDHGPDAGDWVNELSHPGIIERFGVLNALSLPGVPATAVPEDLSTVNTFRLVLNHYFDTGLDLLESKAYYIIGSQPYRYIPIDVSDNFTATTLNEMPRPDNSFPKTTSRTAAAEEDRSEAPFQVDSPILK